ncbi:kinase-like domain-containing protein [Gigaspora rosea]|uniref:Kinase-like domain-containing protein n=1 Tax=Gigaspora rosea TaxID=44941 RepID=A0A397VF43_9GLOM|nr:kinase-like domain-containing protein [Gigaspora rosea]
MGLSLVHYKKFIHRDLHSGNVLINNSIDSTTIADLGISKPIDESSNKDAIYGVIPYVAPEVLKGGKFTQASDIYSFVMIIWEVITGYRPFSDRKHDEHLILDILNGLRPKIPANVPQDLIKLIEKCWHQDSEKRFRTSKDKSSFDNLVFELFKLVNKASRGEIKFPENRDTSILTNKINNQAIYSSRPLTPLISKALTLQSLKLNSNVIADILNQANDSKEIDLDINKM